MAEVGRRRAAGGSLTRSPGRRARSAATLGSARGRPWTGAGESVLSLDREERPADRAGELGLLFRELEARRELGRNLHPGGELESDGPLLLVVDRVHHVDREAALVEHVRHADVLDLERGR